MWTSIINLKLHCNFRCSGPTGRFDCSYFFISTFLAIFFPLFIFIILFPEYVANISNYKIRDSSVFFLLKKSLNVLIWFFLLNKSFFFLATTAYDKYLYKPRHKVEFYNKTRYTLVSIPGWYIERFEVTIVRWKRAKCFSNTLGWVIKYFIVGRLWLLSIIWHVFIIIVGKCQNL